MSGLLNAGVARAQVVLDGSLGGSAGQVVAVGQDTQRRDATYLITDDLGTRRGSNIFFSFRDFNLLENDVATFMGSDSISNLVARITGGPSSIAGTIRSTIPNANLYLLNPAGLAFHGGASLDITGSFHASTSTQLRFDDGTTFDARRAAEAPVLSAASPSAFGFVDARAPIVVDGANLFVEDATLELVGSDIRISNAGVAAGYPGPFDQSAANVLIAAIPGSELNRLNHGHLTIDDADVTAGGNASLIAREIAMKGGITIAHTLQMDADGISIDGTYLGLFSTPRDRIELNATHKITMARNYTSIGAFTMRAPDVHLSGIELFARDLLIESDRVLFDQGARAVGYGGASLTVRALSELTIRENARILAQTLESDGFAHIFLATPQLLIEDRGLVSAGSVFLPRFGQPPGLLVEAAGIVEIEAGQVSLRTGGRIDTSSFSNTAGGLVAITATDSIDIADPTSGIFAVASFDAPAGSVLLRAPRVTVRNGARISTETTPDLRFADGFVNGTLAELLESLRLRGTPPLGFGKAGQVAIRAGEIAIESGGQVSSATSGTGNGGLIQLFADRSLSISGGGSVTASATDSGKAGEIYLRADSIDVRTGGQISSATAGSGDGGLIQLVATESLAVAGGSSITANSTGTGNAGRIELRGGENLRLQDAVVATTSARSSGGDILLEADTIDIANSTVSTNVGAGSGGNIVIDSNVLVLRSDSKVVARAGEGTGGNIRITAPAFLRTQGTVVDASADVGIDGSVDVAAPAADLNASLALLGSDYVDPARRLIERCHLRDREGVGSFRLGGREGIPATPDRAPDARHSAIALSPDPADRGDLAGFMKSVQAAQEMSPVQALRTAEVLESLGELSRARAVIGDALAPREGAMRGSLLALQARLWARSGSWGNAERDFATAERLAQEQGDSGLRARILLDRANGEAERGRSQRANELYAQALASARRAGDRDTLARSLAATARDEGALMAALREVEGLLATHDRLLAELHFGRGLATLPGDAARIRAGEVFARAAEKAQDLGDETAASYAWGYLGELYTHEGRTAEATELTRRALASASRADRAESIYRWAGRLGDALTTAGDLAGAAQTYTLAVHALERLRGGAVLGARAQTEIAAAFPAQRVARSLVDVLLRQASQSTDAEQRTALLQRARSFLESSSRREIRDFFQDECLALEQARPLDDLGDALVVYPVFLDDRVELLVSSDERIDQVRVPVAAARLRAEIDTFRALVADRSTYDYRAPAANLYDWIVEPLAPLLEEAGSGRTLVFVASGPLAGIPLGALYDREHGQFLVEQHAIALSPGLSLIEPRALAGDSHTSLQAGLTQAVDGHPALTATGPEIEGVQKLIGGKVLLDAAFVTSALDRELATRPYEIVHIASHGRFGGSAAETYLLTFDGRVGMSELADLVSQTRFRDRPLELLTLSACETAIGDERTALGLAGVAVRAGARSTLASLWSVNDTSTARLMGVFYDELVRAHAPRAAALQTAQRTLIADPVYRHPAYWSAFVLVGSWQ